MIEWIFQGGKEEFRLKIDNEKKLYLKSKLTNFNWMPFTEKLFRDREQRNKCHIMNIKVPHLTRDELHIYVITEVLYGKFTQCYQYKGCFEDDKWIPSDKVNLEKKYQLEKKLKDGI